MAQAVGWQPERPCGPNAPKLNEQRQKAMRTGGGGGQVFHPQKIPQWQCCALRPFGLICQWFGMVWDARNVVGWMNYIFLYILNALPNFCNLFIGEFGVSHCGRGLERAAPYGKGTIGNGIATERVCSKYPLLAQQPLLELQWGHKFS